MTVLWKFEQERYVWLEWIKDGITKIRKFTYEQYEEFMGNNINEVAEEAKEDEELDFLN